MNMKVLIAVDDSDDAFAAVEFASSLRLDDAEVVLVSISEPQRRPIAVAGGLTGMPAAPVVDDPETRPADERGAWAAFTRAAEALDADALEHETHDSPAEAIIGTAERLGVDLVVVGTRDAGLLSRLFDPSVARNVVDHAPCSVLVVR